MIIQTIPKALSFAQKAKEVTRGHKSEFWKAVADLIKEGESAIVAYHVGADYIKRHGIRVPLTWKDEHKGTGIFFGQHPFLSLTQRGVTPFKDPLHARGETYYRAILSPKRMYEVEEPALLEAYQRIAEDIPPRYAQEIWDFATRKVGDLMKLTKADLHLAFHSKGATEYIVKDPSIVRLMTSRHVAVPHQPFPQNPAKSLEEFLSDNISSPLDYRRERFERKAQTALHHLRSIIKRPKEPFLEVAKYPEDLPLEFVENISIYRNLFPQVAGRLEDLITKIMKITY